MEMYMRTIWKKDYFCSFLQRHKLSFLIFRNVHVREFMVHEHLAVFREYKAFSGEAFKVNKMEISNMNTCAK